MFLHTERNYESVGQWGGQWMDSPLGYFIKWMGCVYQIYTERRRREMPLVS